MKSEIYVQESINDEDGEFCKFIRLDTLQKRIVYFRDKITDLYHKVGKIEVWRANNDTVCDLCEEYVSKLINEVFSAYEVKK